LHINNTTNINNYFFHRHQHVTQSLHFGSSFRNVVILLLPKRLDCI